MTGILDRMPCGYVSFTYQGLIVQANKKFCEMLGYDKQELLGSHIETIMSIANKLIFHTHFFPEIQLKGQVDEMYLSLRSKDGRSIPLLASGSAGMDGIDCAFMPMVKRMSYEQELNDIRRKMDDAYRAKEEAVVKLQMLHKENELKRKELASLNGELERLAAVDDLTGLKNRRYFLAALSVAIESASAANSLFSLLIIDVDFFKNINDTFGHLEGDEVLKKLALLLESNSRIKDVVARYGGEEFVVLLPGVKVERAVEIAERLRIAVESHDWGVSPVSISIGISTFCSGDNADTLLAKADAALYGSKLGGRNRVTHYQDRVVIS